MLESSPGTLSVAGIGLHTGRPCGATISSGPPDSGIVFRRGERTTSASIVSVERNAELTTRLGLEGGSVGMVEHLLAALGALGINDVVIDVEGPEIPALDGSARQWIEMLRPWRRDTLSFVSVERPVFVKSGRASVRMRPVPPGQRPHYHVEIDFPHPLIKRSVFSFRPLDESFEQMVAPARTFGFAKDVERLRRDGFARGGSLRNALVLDSDGVVGSEPMRYEDEPVRHKMLDLLGDLMLLGAWPYALVEAVRPGHRLIHELCAVVQNSGARRLELKRRAGNWQA